MMKPFDAKRFENAIEQSPQAFHQAIEKTLKEIEAPKPPLRRRRLALVIACMILLFAGASLAVMKSVGLSDFLGIPLNGVSATVIGKAALEGEMEHLDVSVEEVFYDGLFLRMTVKASLKNPGNDSLIYLHPNLSFVSGVDVPIDGLPYSLNSFSSIYPNIKYESESESERVQAVEEALRGDRVYFLEIPRSDVVEWRYESPSSIVLFIQADLRDSSDGMPSISGNKTAYIFPDAYKMGFEARLNYAGKEPADTDTWKQCVEKGSFVVSMTPMSRQLERYQLTDYPDDIHGLRIVYDRWIETPMAYYLRLDIKSDEENPILEDYTCYIQLCDAEKKPLSSFSLSRVTFPEPDRKVDSYYELICWKEGNNVPAFIRIEPYLPGAFGGDMPAVYLPISLTPVE